MTALRAASYRALAARMHEHRDLLMEQLFLLWAERLEMEAQS